MGEFANYAGKRIKIGTCENMYYLRWDQRRKVTDSETPLFDPEVLQVVRFRFPWPDEDDTAPGAFEDAFRGFPLYGFEQPKDFEHGSVQFTASNGYLLNLPCPEDGKDSERPYKVHRNGYGGPASLVQQAWRGGRLVGIARCNGCHALYRLEDGYEEAVAVYLRSEADRTHWTPSGVEPYHGEAGAARLHNIADRLLAGYAGYTL